MTSLSKSHLSSWGTPGRAMTTPRGSSTMKEGAVPFGIVDGNRTLRECRLGARCSGVIMKPRLRKRCSISSSRAGSRTSLRPVASAMVWRVRSSCVGPSPPPVITMSERPKSSIDNRPHAVGVVSDDGLVEEVDSNVGEPSRHPCRVGVDDLAEQELGAEMETISAFGMVLFPPARSVRS